ncbi:serine/threonine-protein kinase [Actinoplanes sp. NPDC051861]|uniref:serine/threonine-protein kinase n=1 Tax=Actinoplanes sp. NPDC051861 TaxID=3155170 RepID=UPI0034498EB9
MGQRVLNDRYELRSVLGRGGTAEVWEGFDRRLGRPVAVKVLRPAGVAGSTLPARFEREARIVAALSHPNIVAVHDAGADQDLLYLVMELVEGRSLAHRIAEGPLAVAEAIGIASQVCAALEAATAAGVVHRDLKPANILLTEAGGVKVCDFGLARVTGIAGRDLTHPAQMIGTSTYMAPEQVTGSTVDARTDLYGLGCVLYAMLTGRPPFTGDNAVQIAWHHVERTPAPVSTHRDDVPADLDRLLRSLLAKYPADRPATPDEVRTDLDRLDPAGSAPVEADDHETTVDSRPAPGPGVLAAAAALIAILACTILMNLPGRPHPRAAPAPPVTAPAPTPTRTPPPPSTPAVTTPGRTSPTGLPPGLARCSPAPDQPTGARKGCDRGVKAARRPKN